MYSDSFLQIKDLKVDEHTNQQDSLPPQIQDRVDYGDIVTEDNFELVTIPDQTKVTTRVEVRLSVIRQDREDLDRCTVLSYKRWEGRFEEFSQHRIAVILEDPECLLASRHIVLKERFFKDYFPQRNYSTGDAFSWIMKRVRLSNGQELRKNDIFLYQDLKLTERELETRIELALDDIKFLLD